MTNLLLDANVLVNIGHNKSNAQALLEVISKYKFIYVSALSIFFSELQALQAKNFKHYQANVKLVTAISTEIDFNSAIFNSAHKILNGKDFEDACQVATALEHKCDVLTSDKGLYDLYSSIINVVFVPKD